MSDRGRYDGNIKCKSSIFYWKEEKRGFFGHQSAVFFLFPDSPIHRFASSLLWQRLPVKEYVSDVYVDGKMFCRFIIIIDAKAEGADG